jgi:hypothetical protein
VTPLKPRGAGEAASGTWEKNQMYNLFHLFFNDDDDDDDDDDNSILFNSLLFTC